MKKMTDKLKTRLKIVGATLSAIFSLSSVFTATLAWFAFGESANVTGSSFSVVVAGSGFDLGDINLYKFNYSQRTVGTGHTAVTIIDYLTPYTGNVGKYLFNETEHQFGETVESVWKPVTVMNAFDPIDLIVQNHSLIDLNCNAIYEVTVSSSSLTNCYLTVDSFRLTDKTKQNSEIFLTDCVDFDVYTEADLADGISGHFPSGDEYYPSYYARLGRELTDEEEVFYKIAYLSSLTKQQLSTNDHAHFYGTTPKPETIEVTKNRQSIFTGPNAVKNMKIYINVNYSVSELNKYASSIYQNNIPAVFDYAFDIKITREALV